MAFDRFHNSACFPAPPNLLRYSAFSSSIPALFPLSLSIHLIHPALEDKNSWSMDGFVTFAREATLCGGLTLAEHSSR